VVESERVGEESVNQAVSYVSNNAAYHRHGFRSILLTAVATEAEAQRCANFRHSGRTELCEPPSQAILSDGHDIVQIYDTVRFHAVVLCEEDLGRHAANSGRDRRHCNGG
jgi:hypothetical protein